MGRRVKRGFENAAGMTFGLLHADVLATDGGWRAARKLDGELCGWLCPHVHATRAQAERCPDAESLLGRREP